MIPLRLNLLSPEKRRHLHRMLYFQFIKHVFESALLVLSLCAIALLGGRSILENHLNHLAAQLTNTAQQQNERSLVIQRINTIVRDTKEVQDLYHNWTDTIAPIANTIPPQIMLSGLVLDKRAKTYIFTGTAKTREDLLTLQDAIKHMPGVIEAEVPLSQLTQKENISFSITATIE